MMMRSPAIQAAAAFTRLVERLQPGEWFGLTRHARSVTFDAEAEALPARVRAMIESDAERMGFAERVMPPSVDEDDVPEIDRLRRLANGVLWLQCGESIRVRAEERSIQVAIEDVPTDLRADYRIHRQLVEMIPMSIAMHHALITLRRTLDGVAR